MPLDIKVPEDIKSLHDDRKMELDPMFKRMDKDLDSYHLKEYMSEDPKGKSYTSNEPRTYADTVISYGAKAKMRLAISWMEQEADRKRGSRLEQFIRGVFYEADRNLLKRMHPRLIPSLFFYACVPAGAPPVRVLVTPNEYGEPVWDILPINPRHFVFDVSANGLMWCSHERIAKTSAIEDEYQIDMNVDSNRKITTVLDFWWQGMNAVICTDPMMWLKPPTPHNFKHLPFAIGMMGFEPPAMTTETPGDVDMEYYGDGGLYSTVRQMFKEKNWLMSAHKDIVWENRKPYGEFMTQQGMDVPDDVGKSGKILSVREGEGLTRPPPPILPPAVNNYFGVVMGEGQRGAIPSVSYGEGISSISGYAIKLLSGPLEQKVVGAAIVVEDILEEVCHEIIDQYASGTFAPATLRGFDRDGKQFITKISPEEVKGEWFVNVNLSMNMPQDEMGKYTMASLAKKERLLPEDDIMEKILEVEDIDATHQRMLDDFMRSLPPVMLFDAIQRLKKQGMETQDPALMAKAEMLTMELMKMTMPPMPPQAQGMGGPPMPEEPGRAQRVGGGPSMPPPEMMPVAETGAAPTVEGRPGQPQMQGG